MKSAAYVVASILCLSACNKGPTVELKNASGKQVAQAVQEKGLMNSGSMIEPGLWESKATYSEMNIPGLSPQYAEKMKQSMAQSREKPSHHCITEADLKKPKEDFFGADKDCKFQHFTMGGGKMDIAMVCNREGSTQTMNMSGTYTPTTYSLEMAMNSSGGQENGMSIKGHIDSRRIGQCTGKSDED
jgi:hypothetical protein